ncbi:actin-like ATPase domain-containing protein [Piedraia hortae CBS 480.64]|uniref:Actin-like ATPase domain-containing protein n=1 Tax=Piedraia hortae CBS 480.64 TaxID=1314780 RepID=A0A6A7BYN5_9PEZI|nr:actin-like ATPase domain-containing protein [Piedraia hortae CBS 480.64]
MDSTIRSLKGKSFFDWLAQRVHAFCQHETTTTPLIINIGVAWAFPLTQTSSGENLLLPMGKSFSASEGLEGQNLATLIESACAEVGLDVKVTGVVNDSQAALLSYAYSDPTTRISLILGTGCNAAVYLDDGLMGPGKAPCRPKASHSVVNTELGMLGQSYTLPTTRWDEHLNRVHPRPDFQPLEYRVSGLYLGEVVRLVLSEGIASGVLFGGNAVMSLETPYNLDAGLLSIFIEDQKSARSLFLEKHPVGSHEDADWEFVRLVINLVWMRAQALVAAALFALANLIDDGKKYEKLTIACHGTVIERAPGFREGVQCCLDSLCGRSERLKLELAPESSIFGAAVAAVVETGSRRPFVALRQLRGAFRPPPPPLRHGSDLLAAALSPAVFVSIADKENPDENGKTQEAQMLEMSRKEIDEGVPRALEHSTKWRRMIWRWVDGWIIEPIATGLRFLHLVLIFAPVVFTVPVIWIGVRQVDQNNERSGTLWWYGLLVNSMERAGAAFIKLGQWAASRTDIFPSAMCSIMSSLHSNAPAHSLKATKATIEEAFGRKFEDIFEEFVETPLGVGAIAQVYRAKLKPDLAAKGGDEEPQSLRERALKTVDPLLKSTPQRVPSSYVAVKVLHPSIERNVRRDLRIMAFFANVINAIPTMEWLSFPDEVEQFGEMMKLQLDLRIEAANLTIFRRNFRNRSTASFPFSYNQYTTRQVLVEEFATGIPLELILQNGGGVFQKEIADEGLDAFLHMLLLDNFIHADLHPGNIMVRFYKEAKVDVRPRKTQKPNSASDVTEDVIARLRPHKHNKAAWTDTLSQLDKEGYIPQLVFIDAGLVTQLNEVNRRNFLDLFKAIAEFDGYKAGHLMVERCRQPNAVVDPEVFALKMQHLVLGVKSSTFALSNVKIGDILNQVLNMVRAHHVRLEGDFVNVVLSILLLEGIGRTLDPDLDLFSGALPILRQLGAQSGGSMLRSGDLSMAKVWVGLEARRFLQASVESVEANVKYDRLSPNI